MSDTTAKNDWVSRVLGVSVEATQGNLPHDQRRWGAVKALWFRASNTADQQLAALDAALRNSDDPEYLEIASIGFGSVMGGFREQLLAAFKAIDAAGGQPDAGAIRNLRQVIAGFVDHLVSDPHVGAVDGNELGIPVAIAGTLVPALEDLDDALLQWAREAG